MPWRELQAGERRRVAPVAGVLLLALAWAAWPVADLAHVPPPATSVARPAAAPERPAPAAAPEVARLPGPPIAAPPVVAGPPADARPVASAAGDLAGASAPTCYAPALGLAADDGLRVDVDPTTGLVTLFETDLDLGGVALRRARTSGDATPGAFGAGWRAEHEARVRVVDGGLVVQRLQGVSAFAPVARVDAGEVYVSVLGEVEHLLRAPDGFELLEATGRRLRFDAAGDLVEVAPGYRVERAPGRVRLVDGPTSVTLVLDGAGQVARAEDAAVVTYARDERGELRAVRGALERDYRVEGGRVVHVRAGARELLGARHDLDGRVLELWTPGWRQRYEVGADVVTMRSPGGTWRYALAPDRWVVSTPAGVEQVWFDDRGRPVAAQGPGEARPRERPLDALGRGAPLAPGALDDRRLPGGAALRAARDARGRVVALTAATTPPVRETFEWDDLGRLTASTGPDGRVTRWEYGPDEDGGPLVAEVGPAGRTTYAWQGERLARVGTPGGRSWWFEWADGHLRATDGPAGRTTYRRDARGRPLLRVDASGREWRYAYDEAGRPASVEASGPAGEARLEFTWDDDGHLVRAAGPEGALERARDGDVALLVDEAAGVDVRVTRRGGVERVETPWGAFVRHHDAQGLLLALESPAGTFRFDHDPRGQRAGLTYPNGVVSRARHDDLGRQVALAVRGRDGAPVLDLEHAFSARHERARTTRDGAATARTFDAAGRLVTAGDRAWRFDADGDRTRAGAVASTFDVLGRLEARGDDLALHDGAGRLVRLGDDAFEWDALGRLVRVRRAGRPEVGYAWDALGRLRARSEGGRTVRYVWDDTRLLAEVDEAGALERLWVYGPDLDEPLAYRDGEDGPWCFVHADDLGHVLAYTGADGRRVDRVVYDPWGEVVEGPAAGRPLFFAGRLLDATAGLVLLRARPYDPALGRFLAPDPSGLHGGTNAYAYVSGNPVEYVDPLGLWEVPGWARRSGAWLQDRWGDTRAAVVDGAVGLGHLTGITGTAEEQRAARERAQSRSLGAVDGFVGFVAFDLWDPNLSRWAYDQELARDARVYGEAAGLGLALYSGVGAVRALPAGGGRMPGISRRAGAVRGAPAAATRARRRRGALARAPAWYARTPGTVAAATAGSAQRGAGAPGPAPARRGGRDARQPRRRGRGAAAAATGRWRRARPPGARVRRRRRPPPTTRRGSAGRPGAAPRPERRPRDRDGPRAAAKARTTRRAPRPCAARGPCAASRPCAAHGSRRRARTGPRRDPAPRGDADPAPAGQGFWRGTPRMQDGDLRSGWRHVDARHVAGDHPGGAGDLFRAGTTRRQVEAAAREVVSRGVRVSDPQRRIQTFERRVTVNGRPDNVRVVVDTADGSVITVFPVRGGGH
ncbi:MAG: RHS repeat-associated core domain-containing protein [Planctomycetes bacterium]|nr:RHS repeat-associated core domain-containing protein [Planctomycetota bacterium]